MKKLINTKNLTKKQWLQHRKQGIGGSEAAAILGLNPYKSALSIYIDKTTDQINDIDNERLRQGRDLEEYIAKRFTEKTGKKVRRNNHLMIDENHPYMIADIDREIIGENAILEIKTVSPYAKKEWENNQIPPHYEIQCHHYMAVTGAQKAYIAALIFGESLEIRTIKRDPELIDIIRQKEKHFWQTYIQGHKTPPVDGSTDCDNILNKKYKGGINEEIEINVDKKDLGLYKSNKKIIEELERANKKIEQGIKEKMGDFERAKTDNYQFKWSTVQSQRFDTKKFKKEHKNLYKNYLNQSTTRRFSMKELN